MSDESLLLREIQQRRPFTSRQQEAFLNLQRTSAVLGQVMDRWFKAAGLTRTQYNALRILRGAHPGALACSEVGERMVTPVPDVTRLLDRLEAVGLLSRCRDTRDRRVVNVAISAEGLARLAELDEPLEVKLRELLAPLGDADLASLVALLERARDGKG
jgi:DNA-binding MarR family transcriptional regulator